MMQEYSLKREPSVPQPDLAETTRASAHTLVQGRENQLVRALLESLRCTESGRRLLALHLLGSSDADPTSRFDPQFDSGDRSSQTARFHSDRSAAANGGRVADADVQLSRSASVRRLFYSLCETPVGRQYVGEVFENVIASGAGVRLVTPQPPSLRQSWRRPGQLLELCQTAAAQGGATLWGHRSMLFVLASLGTLAGLPISPATRAIGLCAMMIVMFVFEMFSIDLVALTALSGALAMGLLAPSEAFLGFAHPALMTIAALFCLSDALIQTGAVRRLVGWVVEHVRSPSLTLLAIFGIVFCCSAVMNNTPVVIVFIPILIRLGQQLSIPKTKLLLPLSYVAIWGGFCTLTGSSTNLLVASLAGHRLGWDFGIFEFSAMGCVMASVGMVYMLVVGRHLLPETSVNLGECPAPTTASAPDSLPLVSITIACIIALVVGGLPVATAVIAGTVFLLMTGCITMPDAYRCIDWKVLVVMGCMIGISIAFEKTGAAAMISQQIVQTLGPWGPLAILAGIFLMTNLGTEFLSHNGAAVMMFPIACHAAITLGVSPRPLVMAVLFGASASFATPVGYQTNMFAYSAGGYRFRDVMLVGLPLNLLFAGVAVLVIPMFWPW